MWFYVHAGIWRCRLLVRVPDLQLLGAVQQLYSCCSAPSNSRSGSHTNNRHRHNPSCTENNIHAHTYASVACQLFAAVLVCSCNAAAPHFQPKNKLSHPQPASQQPSMQKNNIYIHVYAFASLQLLSSRLHAAVLLQLLA